jgi:hypothetical protein
VVSVELDELVERWTLLDGEWEMVAGKRGTTRLVFALMLKFYSRHGRFPDGGGDLPGEVVEFVARQVQVSAVDLQGYEFLGRTVEYHRAHGARRSSRTIHIERQGAPRSDRPAELAGGRSEHRRLTPSSLSRRACGTVCVTRT